MEREKGRETDRRAKNVALKRGRETEKEQDEDNPAEKRKLGRNTSEEVKGSRGRDGGRSRS